MTFTEQIFQYARQMRPDLYSISVIENGKKSSLQVSNANKTNDCYSVSKFFTVTALGMLFDEGNLDTDEKIVDILKEYLPEKMDPKWEEVTLHMVMRHRFGIREGFLDIDTEDINEYPKRFGIRNDFLKIVLSVDLPLTPGKEKCYSDAAYYLLSRVVFQKTGRDLYDYLRERLFLPLAFEETAWSRCPMGYSMGATGLYIRTGDIAKLGQLYLEKGIFEGKRILSEKWCHMVLDRGYELEKVSPIGYCKGGMYGQMIYIDPKHKLSVAWEGFDTNGYSQKMMDFLSSLA